MLFAIGCVQSRKCHTNRCPTGVATQNKDRARAINVKDRAIKVKNYHRATLHNFHELLAATGVESADDICRDFLNERIDFKSVARYEDIFPLIEDGIFLQKRPCAEKFKRWVDCWDRASAEVF